MCCGRPPSLGRQPLRVYGTIDFPPLIFAIPRTSAALPASVPMRRHVVCLPVMHIRGLTMNVSRLLHSDGFGACHVDARFCYLVHPFVPTNNTCSAHIPASHAAGGEPPLPMHSGATHPCTNSAARAAGGESPPLRAHLGDPHPAQVPQLERPRRAHPLSQSHMLNVTLDFNIPVCSESRWPASSYARAFTHSRRIPQSP